MKTETGKFLVLSLFLSLVLPCIAGLVLLIGCTAAKTSQVQKEKPSWVFHNIVNAEFVKANRAVPMPENVMLVDSRPYKGKYMKGHIPGAVSMPFSSFDKTIDRLPENKANLLIYYCEGPT